MGPERPLPPAEDPSSGPYPHLDEPSPHPPALFLQDPFLIISSDLRLCRADVYFLYVL